MAKSAILAIEDLAHADIVTVDLRFENLVVTHFARHPQIMGGVRKPHGRQRQRVPHDDLGAVLLGYTRTVDTRSRADLSLSHGCNPVDLVTRRVRRKDRQGLRGILQQSQRRIGRIMQTVVLERTPVTRQQGRRKAYAQQNQETLYDGAQH